MVNQTIHIEIEEFHHDLFIKPSSTSEETAIHICDEESCDCIPQLKDRCLNLSKLVHLHLSKCELKSLPDALSNLPLKSIDLSHNLLTAAPKCLFFGLEFLEHLNLSNNRISVFETEPKCVTSLQSLDLSYNSMHYVPIWLVYAKCRNLLHFYYTNNMMGKTDQGLYAKVNTYCLSKMVLKSARILNENIPFIKSIRTLEILDMSNGMYCKLYRNSFTSHEDLLDNPAWKNNLVVLNLSYLNLGFLPDTVGCLKGLKELHISGNDLFWLPDSIGNLRTLQVLDISFNAVCVLPDTFGNLENLHILKLAGNKLCNIQVLASLKTLEILDLYANELDGFDLDISQYIDIDLEKNCFDAAILLGSVYVEKRESYRKKFSLAQQRDTGPTEENIEDFPSNDTVNDFVEDQELSCSISSSDNVYVEEECWDDERYEPHPDVTASDDEWLGYIPLAKPKQPLIRPLSFENLLYELYADVD